MRYANASGVTLAGVSCRRWRLRFRRRQARAPPAKRGRGQRRRRRTRLVVRSGRRPPGRRRRPLRRRRRQGPTKRMKRPLRRGENEKEGEPGGARRKLSFGSGSGKGSTVQFIRFPSSVEKATSTSTGSSRRALIRLTNSRRTSSRRSAGSRPSWNSCPWARRTCGRGASSASRSAS
ncbi:hypothetical protein SKAU_G00414530 [Synaphobranchus kaupii]|uniref:Uncharacterized protein n=1 Tax=Synaphobranchus kaupii TaxID=118154 RepID=A0A9Q1E788_SYNKA|nr:hypothetical protein SKAU_G00414530 [Synaphobranchus kaupii]